MILDSRFRRVSTLPDLAHNEVHIWAAHPKLLTIAEADLDLLTEEEEHRLDRYYFEKDKWTFKAARILTRRLLGHYLVEPFSSDFELTKFGKPHLPEDVLHFNISHSGGCVVVAFSRSEALGVDIEHCKAGVSFGQLSKRFFSLPERAYLESHDFLAKEFYRIWTRKEAFIKADGRGVHLPLDGFSVVGSEDEASNWLYVDAANVIGPKASWVVQDFRFNNDIMGALCTGSKYHLKFYRLESDMLQDLW